MAGNIFVQAGIALLLGLLVGLQRERSGSSIAGIRTFPLIALFGTVCGQLAGEFGGWIVAAGLVSVGALFFVANIAKLKAGEVDPGLTTEMAALVLFGVGAYLVKGQPHAMGLAVAVGGAVAILLHLKAPMHAFVKKMGETDLKAIMQFTLISLVILPVLPNRTYGPYQVLNPFKIWLMVVLIVGIGLVGYVIYKLLGARAGTLLGGVLGGLISSTATTVSYSRRTKDAPSAANLAALVIMLASATVFVRVLIEISAVAGAHFTQLAPPLLAMLGVCALLAGWLYFFGDKKASEMPVQGNPAELKSALFFGGLYALVLLAVAAAKNHFGSGGLFVVAVLSGLTDMDAITLSTAQLVNDGRVETSTAWRVIMAASISNLVFKAGIVALMGDRKLFVRIAALFSIAAVAGGLMLWLWPDAKSQ